MPGREYRGKKKYTAGIIIIRLIIRNNIKNIKRKKESRKEEHERWIIDVQISDDEKRRIKNEHLINIVYGKLE